MRHLQKKSYILLLPKFLKDIIDELESDNLKKRVARISFWALSGSVFSKFFLLISSILVARIIGKVHYGEYGIIQSTLNFFAVFAGFSLGTTSTKYVAELRDTDPVKAGNIIASSNFVAGFFGLCVTLIFILFSHIISNKLMGSDNLSDEMRIASVLLFFNAINGAQAGALAGFEDFKSIFRISLVSGMATLISQILMVFAFGLKGAFLGLGIAYTLQFIYGFILLRKTAKKHGINIILNRSLSDISYIWRFSLPAVLGGIVVSLSLWISNLFLVNHFNGFNEVAIYNAASQWQNVILFIPMAISQVSLPIFSNMKTDILRLKKLIRYNLVINFLICLFLAIIFSAFSTLIMNSYGRGFRDGTSVVVILSIAAVLISTNMVIGQIIAGLGKMWTGFAINLIWACVFLLLAYRFIENGKGAIGLAEALLIAYLVHTVIVSIFSIYFIRRNASPTFF